MPKITEIVNPNTRSGIGKTGKPWVMMTIRTDDGKEATMFAPGTVGDEVSLTFNQQYNNYFAEKMTPAKQEKTELQDTLNTILGSLGRIERHLEINPVKDVMEKKKDVLPDEDSLVEDQPVDLGSIPF